MKKTTPWKFALTIPEAAIGLYTLAAAGKDATGNFFSDELTLNVVPASPLQTLCVSPANSLILAPAPLRALTENRTGIELPVPLRGRVGERERPWLFV